MIIKDGAKMSKSKGNVVSPDGLINSYGADTVRLYTLFIGPPEKDAEWSDRGVEGSYRFLGRTWRLVEKGHRSWVMGHGEVHNGRAGSNPPYDSKDIENLKRKTHQTIKKVTEDLDGGFHFNTAISAIMELVNEAYDFLSKESLGQSDSGVLKEAVETVVILLAPLVPHIGEEMWMMLGKKNSIFRHSWPSYDKSAIVEKVISVAIQINGKLRSKIDVPFDITEDALKKAVLSDLKTQSWIGEKSVKHLVVVPKKLVNIVI